MKFPIGNYYVEVIDKQYRVHPTKNIILRLHDESKSLRIQYQVQKITQIRRKQKVIENIKDEFIVKNYPKNKQPVIQHQQPKVTPPNCPSSKRKNWLDFDKGYYCQNCE